MLEERSKSRRPELLMMMVMVTMMMILETWVNPANGFVRRLTISHHGSPELKKARSCQAHDPPPIGLSHDAYHPVGRKPSKTSIGSMSPTRAARPNGPFGSLVAPMSKQDTVGLLQVLRTRHCHPTCIVVIPPQSSSPCIIIIIIIIIIKIIR